MAAVAGGDCATLTDGVIADGAIGTAKRYYGAGRTVGSVAEREIHGVLVFDACSSETMDGWMVMGSDMMMGWVGGIRDAKSVGEKVVVAGWCPRLPSQTLPAT